MERFGRESLREHILAQATIAHQRYAPLETEKLDTLLHDPECVRYPTRLLFELGDMATHQFVHPGPRPARPDTGEMVIFVHPDLSTRPDMLPAAVAYAVPQINYGDVVTDEHCLLYGATLLGMVADEYYDRLCAIADLVGAMPKSS